MSDGNIYERLTRVMADVGAVGKNKTNQQQNFKYRAIDDFIQAVHPALVAQGVVMMPKVIDKSMDVRTRLKDGREVGVTVHVVLTVEFTFYAPDGSSLACVTVGEAADTADKASNKAMSAALKYALMQSLMVPLEDIADHDRESPDMGSRTPAPPPAVIEDPERAAVRARIGALNPELQARMKTFFMDQKLPKVADLTDEQLAIVKAELKELEGE